jgi:O-acetyl-ADP-ribose deacetylase
VKSIAFPCISTGIYGYPIDAAALVAVSTVAELLPRHEAFEEVVFCCFSARALRVYEQILSGPT